MTNQIDELKRKRDQLNARIQRAEARLRATEKKAYDRIKVLAGAMLLEKVKGGGISERELLADLDQFLQREGERLAVLGEDGTGSERLRTLITP